MEKVLQEQVKEGSLGEESLSVALKRKITLLQCRDQQTMACRLVVLILNKVLLKYSQANSFVYCVLLFLYFSSKD